ncbi:MAG: preprotein translocase subunit SecG [Filifactoraceae bacterium]
MRTFLLVLEIICSLVLIASVLLQSSNKAGLGVISGAAEQLAGNKARGMDVVFRRVTKVCAVLFILLAIALVALQ